MINLKEYQEDVWKNKGIVEAERYWKTKRHKHRRKKFVKYLSGHEFSSIFEVGSNSGKNLFYIKNVFPNVIVGGLDINSDAITLAKTRIPDGNFYNDSVYNMDTTDKYDIVFTSATLLHIPSSLVRSAVKKCIEKANKYVLLMETYSDSEYGTNVVINGPVILKPINKITKTIRCNHHYGKIFSSLGYKSRIIKFSDEQDAMHLIIANIEK